jgi:hypothetical protein
VLELRKDAVGGGCSLLSPDVVLHLRDQALAVPADGDVRTRRLRMLGDVGKRLTDDEVGSRSTEAGGRSSTSTWTSAASRNAPRAPTRGVDPPVGEHGRMDPAGEVADLGDRALASPSVVRTRLG